MSFRIRRAFSFRNLGQTWSRKATFGMSVMMRSRETHRKIAGIDDLFGTSGIGVVDDGFRIVLGGES